MGRVWTIAALVALMGCRTMEPVAQAEGDAKATAPYHQVTYCADGLRLTFAPGVDSLSDAAGHRTYGERGDGVAITFGAGGVFHVVYREGISIELGSTQRPTKIVCLSPQPIPFEFANRMAATGVP